MIDHPPAPRGQVTAWFRTARLLVIAAFVLSQAPLVFAQSTPASDSTSTSDAAIAQAPARPTNGEPNWPCVQRRVASISAGVVWSGPDPAQAGAWDKDFEAAALAQKLASRRTTLDDVNGLLDAFADKAGADKDVRLTRVFVGLLELINTERNRILLGIERYARGQNMLAERVRMESDKLGDATDAPNAPTSKEVEELQTVLKWDKRIFEERGRSLTYVCETPVLLEQRLFEVARRIQQRL